MLKKVVTDFGNDINRNQSVSQLSVGDILMTFIDIFVNPRLNKILLL